MMKLRSSGVMMIVVTAILALFSMLVVWHDKAPGDLRAEELLPPMILLSEMAPTINTLFAQFDLQDPDAFYLIGIDDSMTWPLDLKRASYRDPVAAAIEFRKTRTAFADAVSVYRYRSIEDFIQSLNELERQAPGTLASKDMHSWIIVPVHPGDISLKLIVAAALILSALIITATLKKTS
ncbi:MAG: hypothetical protein K9M49_00320 [Candidatus Marinimicrobia bacterium]|nr:hypothetical protein [Candidatus Neomarinimicrobiota bacterium]MCF7903571.1 hypothetical protein [Candidatus Neomarinimicrobiota bacterium]